MHGRPSLPAARRVSGSQRVPGELFGLEGVVGERLDLLVFVEVDVGAVVTDAFARLGDEGLSDVELPRGLFGAALAQASVDAREHARAYEEVDHHVAEAARGELLVDDV